MGNAGMANALVDSGCTHTCLPSSKADDLMRAGIRIRMVNGYAGIANGGQAEIVGLARIPLSIATNQGEVKWTGDCMLVKRLPYELILGVNTIKGLGTSIDFGKDTVTFQSEGGSACPVVQALPIDAVVPEPDADGVPEAEWRDVTFEPEVEHNDETFKHPELTPEQTKEFNELLREWKQEFATSPGQCNVLEHTIYLEGNPAPVKQRYRLLSPALQEQVHAEIKKLLDKGIVRPSISPWASPIVVVKKKNGDIRVCTDYRKLNELSAGNAYPLPRIHEMLDRLKSAYYVSTLDLESGYHQIKMAEASVPLTAFTVPGLGLFEYLFSPFGLKSMPSCFQSLMDALLRECSEFAGVYLDDIVIFSKDFESHMKHVRKIFEILRRAALRINWKKCRFVEAETPYLGFVVGGGKIRAQEEKCAAIAKYPAPRNVKEVRQFFGLANFMRRFIEHFADTAAPISELLKKGRAFRWTTECQQAFDTLKQQLSSPPVLSCPDFAHEFQVHSDASCIAVGGLLVQEIDGEKRVVAYTSKKLNPAQQKYDTAERELLAVLHCVSVWRHYLYGVRFKVITDNTSIKWLRELKEPTGRLCRWVTLLSQYDMEIIHRAGKEHQAPDALSRIAIDAQIAAIQLSPIPSFQNVQCPYYTNLVAKVKHNPSAFPAFLLKDDNMLYKTVTNRVTKVAELRLVVPEDYREDILKDYHTAAPAGHLGINKTAEKIGRLYYWPKMAGCIRRYIQKCALCRTYKPRNTAPQGLMSAKPASVVPGQLWSADLVGPLPRSQSGFMYIAVFTENCSRWIEAVPIRTATAQNVIKAFRENVVLKFGPPEILLVDNGTQYTSNLFRDFCASHRIKLNYLPRFYPRGNPTEAQNKTIKRTLAILAGLDHRSWADMLPYAVYAIRSSVSEATKFSPAKLMYGRELRPFYDIAPPTNHSDLVPFDPLSYNGQLSGEMDRVFKLVKKAVERGRAQQQQRYNLRRADVTFQVGELVYRENFQQSNAGNYVTAKFLPKRIGPFVIDKVHSPTQYELKTMSGQAAGRWHVSHLMSAVT